MWYTLDEHGNPVPEPDVLVAARWFEANGDRRRVARDEIGDATVSTVFLGLDHGFGGGEPVLYETMVFGGTLDRHQERYTSREAAVLRHVELVGQLRAAEPPSGWRATLEFRRT